MERNRTCILLIIFLSFICFQLQAQEKKPGESDSTKFYRDIENFSKKSKFTKMLYRAVLRPVAAPASTPKNKKALKLKYPNLDLYNCRIIRDISIEVTDPFGYSLLDTVRKPDGLIQKGGNSLHMKTRRFIVRNFLQFKSGDEFEAYQVSESERLLRQSGLFREVIIYAVSNKKMKDSVDVIVRCVDRWSIYLDVVATTSALRIRLTDRNIGGFGHTFRNRVNFNLDGFEGYSLRYDINRIGKTYITAQLLHEDLDGHSRSDAISLTRPFYSPVTKWSYGTTVFDVKYPETIFYSDAFYNVPTIRSRGYDVYLSRSIRLEQHGATFERGARFTNLILSGRTLKQTQEASGLEGVDTLNIYRTINYYMGMVALSDISFEQENYIVRFGEIEDIPLGRFLGVTGGFDPLRGSQYAGLRAGFSSYRNLHYFSLIGNYGKFFEASGATRNIFNLRMTAFSPLVVAGQWKFRQFIRGNYVTGINMQANRYLLLGSEPGLERANAEPLVGFNRLAIGLQTQAYAPLQLIGFRFAPVLYLIGGMISQERSELFNGRVYSALGIGLLIRNDYLINSTFQISISVFPNLFGSDQWYRLNDIRTSDFALPSLQQDKPEFVNYQ